MAEFGPLDSYTESVYYLSMMIIRNGSRVVVVSSNGDGSYRDGQFVSTNFTASFFVNCTPNRVDGDICNQRGTFKTLAGAQRWANRTLAAHVGR